MLFLGLGWWLKAGRSESRAEAGARSGSLSPVAVLLDWSLSRGELDEGK